MLITALIPVLERAYNQTARIKMSPATVTPTPIPIFWAFVRPFELFSMSCRTESGDNWGWGDIVPAELEDL